VSLLIGVNNQYRGEPIEKYLEEFRLLLERSVSFAGNQPNRVFVLSIPDWGVTPFAQDRNPYTIRMEIDAYNNGNRTIARQLGTNYIDITEISRRADVDPTLLAGDELHPSGKMYALWVEKMFPTIKEILDYEEK
jgi:lysophospholipase L1-like esterase